MSISILFSPVMSHAVVVALTATVKPMRTGLARPPLFVHRAE